MDCRSTRTELNALLDGELPPPVRVVVEAHLAECAACRAEAEELRRLSIALAAARPGPAGGAAREAEIARILAETAGPVFTTKTPRHQAHQESQKTYTASLVSWCLGGKYGFYRAAAALFLMICGAVLYEGWRSLQRLTAEKTASGTADAEILALLRRHAGAGAAEQETLARSLGEADVPRLVAALDAPDLRVQVAAGRILGRYRDAKVADLILAHARRRGLLGGSDWTLGELGAEPEDVAAVPALFDLAAGGRGDRAYAVDALRRLAASGRGGPADGRERVRRTLLERLASADESVRSRAAAIAAEVYGIEIDSNPEEVRRAVENLH